MGEEKERTIRIIKDKKHKIGYSFDVKEVDYEYICGPRTNNLWYKVLQDTGREVIAKIPDGF